MRALRFGPGLAAGVGLGAFVDGILFHQILQWHHLVSDDVTVRTVGGLEQNTLADGLFHAFAWMVCAYAIWALWKAGRAGTMPERRVLLGAVTAAFGAFSLFDAIVMHFVLGLHHLYERGDFELGGDVLYAVFSALVLLAGVAVGGREAGPPIRPSTARRRGTRPDVHIR